MTQNNAIYNSRIEDLEELLHRDFKQFSCQVCKENIAKKNIISTSQVPNCGQKFSQLHESETHYNAVHRCAESKCHLK